MSSNQQNVSVEHDIIMRGRRVIDITGVKQVESFDSEEFLLETVMGFFNNSWSKFANEKFRCRKKVLYRLKGKFMRCCILMRIKGRKLKASLVSCLNESNNSVVYDALNDRNGCLDWSVFRYIPTIFKTSRT